MCGDKLQKQNDLIRTLLLELGTMAPKYTQHKLVCSVSPTKDLVRKSLKLLVGNRIKNVCQKQEAQ